MKTRKFPISRKLRPVGCIRHAEIVIDLCEDETVGNFTMTSYHECWTGVEWLPVGNSDNYWKFSDAVEAAKSQVASLS